VHIKNTRRKTNKMVERSLWIYTLLLVSLTAIAWGTYWVQGSPEITRPLFDSGDHFGDLTDYTGKISHLGEGAAALGNGFPVYNYPAPAAFVYAFFLRGFPSHPVRAFLLVLAIGLLCGSILLWRAASNSPGTIRTNWALAGVIFSTATFGYPLLFAADRGNLEGIVALILGIGLVLFLMQRNYAAAVFIGLAASLKPFPGIFLLLLLRKKLYREFVVGVATTGLSVLLALTALGPTPLAAYRGLRPGFGIYYYVNIAQFLPPTLTRFNHSITDALKAIASSWGTVSALDLYRLLAAGMVLGVAGAVFVLLAIFKVPTVNQMIMLGVAVALFPPISADYTLLALYVPFGAFVIFLMKDVAMEHAEFSRRNILIVLMLFALLFSPATFLGQFAGVSKTLALVCLLLAARRFPMPSLLFGEETQNRPPLSKCS
jgi:Glycosyltransferase family 87